MDCAECRYDFAEVPADEVGPRLRELAAGYAEALEHSPEVLRRRPQPDVWSPHEYACHVRDVLWNLRDRVLLALVEDHPVFAPIHREERVTLARYGDEEPGLVAQGIGLGAELLALLFDGMGHEQLGRNGVYAGASRDVLWIGRQGVHEARHHLQDLRCSLQPAQG